MNKAQSAERESDPVLTTREAAEILGVSVSTAQIWIESGAIASWKTPGGHRRVRLSAVRRLLEDQDTAQAGHAVQPAVESAIGGEFLPAQAPAYPVPDNEAERLRMLAASHLIDSPPEQVFDRLTWLATQITQAPIALVSLLTARRQWFKSHHGIEAAETPREWAFCSYAILESQPFIVEDARADDRFRNNPLVTGAPHIRFYAGFPLIAKNDTRLGTLCIIDRETRQLTAEQVQCLQELSNIASEEISRRL
jgi:excisionase family DNA binding protein